MSAQRLELKLDMESAQALRELAGILSHVIGDMELSDQRLIRSFEDVWDGLGVHAADIQELINVATDAEKAVREAAEELPGMMIKTAEKIETYVSSKPGSK